MDDRDLERTLRAGLAARAEKTDVRAAGRVLDATRRAVVVRRGRRRAALAAAAVAVLVGGGATAVVVGGGDDDPQQVATDPTSAPPEPAGPWRTESWGGLTVDVPADWGYGGAPMHSGGDVVACPGAPETGDGDIGWVGRPILSSDMCTVYPWLSSSPQEQSTTPYVWLGAAVEPGVVTYAGGLVEETVEVEGETLTVASTDPALRQHIIDSARPVEECPDSWGDTIPAGNSGMTDEGRGDPIDAVVCSYRREGNGYALTYARTVETDVVDRSWQAQAAAARITHDDTCMGEGPDEFVVVEARYTDRFGSEPLVQRAVFEMGCAGEVDLGPDFLDNGNQIRTRMTRAGVTPWADAGIATVVHAPTDGQFLAPLLIGLQG